MSWPRGFSIEVFPVFFGAVGLLVAEEIYAIVRNLDARLRFDFGDEVRGKFDRNI